MNDNTSSTSAIAERTQTFDLSPRSLAEAMQMADLLSNSSIIPKEFIGKPGNILVAVQWGAEIGLKPMQAMQSIAVINGKPTLYGDAVLALVLSSPHCKDVLETFEGDPAKEDYAAVCVAQRHGRVDVTARFTIKDAKVAGLIGKSGPWTQYRDRMLKMRARSFGLRDQFADVLRGMDITEVVMDIEPTPPALTVIPKTAKQIGDNAKGVIEESEARDELVQAMNQIAEKGDLEAMQKYWSKTLTKEQRVLVGQDELARVKGVIEEVKARAAQASTEATTQDPASSTTAAPTYDELMDDLVKSKNADDVALVRSCCGHLGEQEKAEVLAGCEAKDKEFAAHG